MALIIADRIKETTLSTGTGALALAGAATGYRAFNAVCSAADTVYYAIEAVDSNGRPTGDWEVGLGTYSSADTLTRTTPQSSSNAGAAVSFAAGTKNVWLDSSATQLTAFSTFNPAIPGPIGGTTPAAITGTTITATTKFLMPDGSATVPGWGWASDDDGTGTGMYRSAANEIAVAINGVQNSIWRTGGAFYLLTSNAALFMGSSGDSIIAYSGVNQFRFGTTNGSTVTSRTEINKAVAGIADNVATTLFTVTIPNAAHTASIELHIAGAMGAGGAIGAREAAASNKYTITVVRTAGVGAVATIGTAFGASAANVAGAGSVTCVATLGAIAGAVGASNTFTILVTVTKAGGSSDNHTCQGHAKLINAAATGITIA